MNIIQTPSSNFNERPSAIDSIIIHYTDMLSAEAALAWLINPDSHVSAHYLIDEQGQVYQIVAEEHRAWHAGESYWQGRTNLNDCSIGIELANPGHSHGYVSFPEPQIKSLIELCLVIKDRWNIPSNRILGHSDIAPQRKQDPGHLFPWERLAQEGLGLWPEKASLRGAHSLVMEKDVMLNKCPSPVHSLREFTTSPTRGEVSLINDSFLFDPTEEKCNIGKDTSPLVGEVGLSQCEAEAKGRVRGNGDPDFIGLAMTTDGLHSTLSTIGYDTTSPHHALTAFQRHFQPHKVDGIADEETHTLLQALLKLPNMLI